MKTKTKPDFERYMQQQIEAIKSFKEELEQRYDQEISSDRAARIWIEEFANRFRGQYEGNNSSPLDNGNTDNI
ncbi:MAG: hypothetical protein ACQEP7_02590 [bacterium]